MIIHRFGLPQTIIVDNVLVLNGSRVLAFAQDHGIKFVILHHIMLKQMDKLSPPTKSLRTISER